MNEYEYDTFFDSITYLDSSLDQLYDDCIGIDLISEIKDVFNDDFVAESQNSTETTYLETSDNSTQTLNISCSCTKNQCLKKYCGCRKEGIECNDYCNCTDCKNRS